jgi:hypothetical protein
VCDIHTAAELKPHEVLLDVGGGSINTLHRWQCSWGGCRRMYAHEFGYFDFELGQPLNAGHVGTKPHCRNHEHPVALFLRRTQDGSLSYECPEPTCGHTLPHKSDDHEAQTE